ncbi:MAG: GNAT family N-acetyltransferase [Sphingopyxis sp.]
MFRIICYPAGNGLYCGRIERMMSERYSDQTADQSWDCGPVCTPADAAGADDGTGGARVPHGAGPVGMMVAPPGQPMPDSPNATANPEGSISPGNPVTSVTLINLGSMAGAPAGLAAELCALSARMADANIFAEPWMLLPAMQHCSGARPAWLALIRDGAGALVGAVPISIADHFGRLPIRHWTLWSHPNAFLHAAAMAAGWESACWAALITHLHSAHRGDGLPRCAMFAVDAVPDDSAVYHGLMDAAGALGLRVVVETRTTRAMLATTMPAETYWDESVRAKKRKELRRQWARLNEQGELTTQHLPPHGDAAPWIDEFLTLEASGWKGENGSALACQADTKAFFTSAMAAAHTGGRLAMTALRVDGRAIAMLITLTGGNAGFSFKTAFDEAYARFSPGVLLQRESLGLLVGQRLDWIDSCAAQDHPMIDSLWRERRTVLSLSLPMPGVRAGAVFAMGQTAKQAWHWIKGLRVKGPRANGAAQSAPATPRPDPANMTKGPIAQQDDE